MVAGRWTTAVEWHLLPSIGTGREFVDRNRSKFGALERWHVNQLPGCEGTRQLHHQRPQGNRVDHAVESS